MRHGPLTSTDPATRRQSAPGRSSGARRFSAWLLIWLVVVPGVAYAKLSDRESLTEAIARKQSNAPLRVTGHVRGLAPGVSRPLPVRIRNRYGDPVLIQRLRVLVEDASSDCPASNLRVSRFRGRKSVSVGGVRRIRLRVTMRTDAPDACQRERFPLLFWLGGRAR